MATSENEYYLRAILLLSEGGSYISKEILNKERQRKGVGLGELLLKSKSKLKHELHRKQIEKLYPQAGSTDVNSWDLQMLIIVILRLFRSSLSTEVRNKLNVIKLQRNEVLAHSSSVSLNISQYEDIQDQLKEALRVLASVCDQTVQDECEHFIDKYSTGPLDIESARRQLQQIQNTEELFKEVLQNLEKSKQDVIQSVNSSASAVVDRMAAMEKNIIEYLERMQESSEEKFSKMVKVRTNVELTVKGPSQELVDTIEQLLICMFNKTESSEEFEQVKQRVNELLSELEGKGITVKETVRKCIILEFECSTYAAVLDFFYYMRSEKYKDCLEMLARSFRRKYQLKEELTISSTIPINCLEHLKDIVERELSVTDKLQHDGVYLLENAKTTSEEVYARSLKLELESTSTDGLTHLFYFFHEGKGISHLNGIAEALSSHFSTPVTLSSSLNLIDFKNALDVICAGKRQLQDCCVSEKADANIYEETELQKGDIPIDKARTELVKDKNPEEILDATEHCGLFEYEKARDLKNMATAGSTNDSVYLFLLQKLVIDGGTTVLRNIFNQNLPQPLQTFLAIEKATIYRLKTTKIITQAQYDKLYPPGGQPANSADFDITLIICLLRGIPSLGLNPNYKWNKPPPPSDTTLEADLHRLRGLRNEVAHVSSTGVVKQASFPVKWTEIEQFKKKVLAQVLLRLNSAVAKPLPDLQSILDSYMQESLDPIEQVRFQTEITQWKENERGLELDIEQVKKQLTQHDQEVKQVKTELKQQDQEVKQVKTELQQQDQEVKQVKTELKQQDQEVKQVKTELKQQDQEVKQVKTELKQQDQEVKQVKTELKQQDQEVKQVKTELKQQDQEVKQVKTELKQQDQEVKQLKTELKQHVERSDRGVRGQKCKTLEIEQRLEVLESKKGKQTADEEKQAYEKLKNDLKDDLITFYRHNHRTIRLSPLLEEDAPLLKYYVTPVIKLVKLKTAHGCRREEERIPVSSLHDMFYKEGKVCSEVYLAADAGLGKTSLSKRLALTWCQAKKPIEDEKGHFSNEDITAMNEFDFLFLLLLRDCSNKCDIDGMILQQNTSRLAHVLSDPKDLENILSREKCLIILDGLDEWLHPPGKCKQGWSNLPHQNIREDVTVLTTTRPWKLSVLGSESSHVSHQLELSGLDEDSAATLKKSVLSHLLEKSVGGQENEEKINEFVSKFNKELQKSAISDLEASPLLLMYLLFVWYYYKRLGNTKCEIYSEIIELLLSRTAQKPSIAKEVHGSIPHCYKNLNDCRKFYGFLTSLGKLAFKTLLKETKENTLVFDRIEAEQNLDNESIIFCLNSGILTQSKEYESLLRQTTKMSFSHKSVQEYFAALYTSSCTKQSSVLETMKSKCKCIKDILEISKILLFISGINADMLSLISQELARIVNDDEITCKYRSSTEKVYYHPLKEYQDLWVSCCKEMSRENQANLCIEDVFISYRCKQKQYRENLRLLISPKQQNIKSVYIYMFETPFKSTREVIDYFSLTRLDNLEKIWYHGDSDSVIAVLLKTSVKCLYLFSASLDFPRLPCKEVTSLDKLEVIDICRFSLSHSEFTEFYNYLSWSKSLREIKLRLLRCTDHGRDCPGSRLKLLQHSQLKTLSLDDIPVAVTEIEINLAILEKCKLELLYDPDPVLTFRNHPASDINLPGNTHVVLYHVTMAASSLRQLVDLIQELPQSFLVEIKDCRIKPEDEFRRQIHRINTSSQFRMLKELEEDSDGRKTFKFETIRAGH